MEEYKLIPFSGGYWASNKGNIKNRQGKPLSQKTKSNGYKEVCLYIDKKPYMKYVHRLIIETWSIPIQQGKQVNHIDGDKSNNCIENLEVVTPSENSKHSYHVLGNKAPVMKGEKHPNAKLTKDEVLQIRHMFKKGLDARLMAKTFNTPLSTIRKICYRQTWKHI